MSSESLSIDGDAYISTKEAAGLTGYTSDYIGQLARGGKFASVLHGKARFVHKEELLLYLKENASKKHKKTLASVLPETTATQSDRAQEVKTKKEETQEHDTTATLQQKQQTQKHSEDFQTITQPAMPDVVWRSLPTDEFAPTASSSLLSKLSVSIATLILAVSLTIVSLPLYRNTAMGDLVSVGAGAIDDAVGQIHIDITVIDAIQNNVVASTLTSTIGSRVVSWYCSLLSILEPLGVAGCQSGTSVVTEEGTQLQPTPRGGLVVVPGTGDETADKETINQIRGAFSDEVLVTPGPDGLSGSIEPVFKDRVGNPYLYVIVPVEGE